MAQLKRMAIPRQQPSGSANEASDEMEACTIPSPAVDYGAEDAPEVTWDGWRWDPDADPDALTCLHSNVTFPNDAYETNTTIWGPTHFGYASVEMTTIKSAYPDGLSRCSACDAETWWGETRYDSDYKHGIYLQGCIDELKNSLLTDILEALENSFRLTGNVTHGAAALELMDAFATAWGSWLWKDADYAHGTKQTLLSYYRDGNHNKWPHTCFNGDDDARGKCCNIQGGFRDAVPIARMFDWFKTLLGLPEDLGDLKFRPSTLPDAAASSEPNVKASAKLGYDVATRVFNDIFGRRLDWYRDCDYADGGPDLEGGDLHYWGEGTNLGKHLDFARMVELLPDEHDSYMGSLMDWLTIMIQKHNRDGLWHEGWAYSLGSVSGTIEFVQKNLMPYCEIYPTGVCASELGAKLPMYFEHASRAWKSAVDLEYPNCQIPSNARLRGVRARGRRAP